MVADSGPLSEIGMCGFMAMSIPGEGKVVSYSRMLTARRNDQVEKHHLIVIMAVVQPGNIRVLKPERVDVW